MLKNIGIVNDYLTLNIEMCRDLIIIFADDIIYSYLKNKIIHSSKKYEQIFTI